MRAVDVRAGDRNIHADRQSANDMRVRHIVSVADIAEVQAFERTFVLADGHQVGEDLAGMRIIGQTVDDRDMAVSGEIFDFLLLKGTDHNAV